MINIATYGSETIKTTILVPNFNLQMAALVQNEIFYVDMLADH